MRLEKPAPAGDAFKLIIPPVEWKEIHALARHFTSIAIIALEMIWTISPDCLPEFGAKPPV